MRAASPQSSRGSLESGSVDLGIALRRFRIKTRPRCTAGTYWPRTLFEVNEIIYTRTSKICQTVLCVHETRPSRHCCPGRPKSPFRSSTPYQNRKVLAFLTGLHRAAPSTFVLLSSERSSPTFLGIVNSPNQLNPWRIGASTCRFNHPHSNCRFPWA